MIKVIFLDVIGVLYLSGSRNASLISRLEELKQEHGLKLVITTNSSINRENDPHGLTQIADLIVNSTPTTPKPSPEFWNDAFSHTLALLPGLKIEEVLVVDDRTDIIESARDFGFQTLHFVPGSAEKALAQVFLEKADRDRVVVLSSSEEIDQYFADL